MLADLGAEVVKVADAAGADTLRYFPPLVGGVGAAYAFLNRGKRSVILHLRSPEGVAEARRLALWADVLVESYRPGVMGRMGLGYEDLRAENAGLIYCSITGYGQSGPWRDRAGHDINYLASSGMASVTGTRDGVPVLPGMQVTDVGGGSLMGVVAILAAVHQKARSGVGHFLDVSMTDGAMSLLTMHAANALVSAGAQPGYGEGLLWGSVPAYRFYRCGDGGWLAVGALEPKFWTRLIAALELPELEGSGLSQGKRRAQVEAVLEARFASRSRDEWAALFADVDCCVSPVLSIVEAFETPHARARGMRVEVPVGDDTTPQPGCPLRFE
jgi:crotonobetainyl-CoA:carnitine CoA-transferase CaiB-like acyl-CoA transferase